MIRRNFLLIVILAMLFAAYGPVGEAEGSAPAFVSGSDVRVQIPRSQNGGGKLGRRTPVSSRESCSSADVFAPLEFHANIETVGVVAGNAGLAPGAEMSYRRSGEIAWQAGHPLVRIDDGRLIGSLFGLSPATTYEVRVSDGVTEYAGSVTTQPDELQFTPTVILHVNDDALPGGDGSASAPFQTVQEAVDIAGPGTQVLVADGTYHEAVSFPASGAAGQWIQVKAEGGASILEGGGSSPAIFGRGTPAPRCGSQELGRRLTIWRVTGNATIPTTIVRG